ncbi:DNA-3-methyladenine glycosylase [Puniceicoccaceae bacterium K14]|nr:DNA-3-methyladenine glycosylase [Puniceicoccaceae bacterium K14]
MGRVLIAGDFSSKDTVSLARDLLGKYLVMGEYAAPIVEAEAYDGPEDLACHASKGRTKRTEVMFGKPGVWYVYLIYGMHEMLNIVTGPKDYPAAILIRGLGGVVGPGRLTRRFGVDRKFNGLPAKPSNGLYIEDRGNDILDADVEVTSRIGVDYAGPDWSQRPYRFVLNESGWRHLQRRLPQ